MMKIGGETVHLQIENEYIKTNDDGFICFALECEKLKCLCKYINFCNYIYFSVDIRVLHW